MRMGVESGLFGIEQNLGDTFEPKREQEQYASEATLSYPDGEAGWMQDVPGSPPNPHTGFPDFTRFPNTDGYPAIWGGSGREEGQPDPLEEIRAFYAEYFGEDWRRRKFSDKQFRSKYPHDTPERIRNFILRYERIDWRRKTSKTEYLKGINEMTRIMNNYPEIYYSTMQELNERGEGSQ